MRAERSRTFDRGLLTREENTRRDHVVNVVLDAGLGTA